jgi:predicted membrane chloride channel (bestrophin family)
MITYNQSAFGLNLIFRFQGSAVYRSIVPSLIAVGIFFLIRNYSSADAEVGEQIAHPYAIGVLVASTTFLLIFRANQGYARYWEAATAVHQMMSKWMDATTHTGVYHMQCAHYKDIKPPSYFDYPELNALYMTRDREKGFVPPEEPSEHHESTAPPLARNGSLRSLRPNPSERHTLKTQKQAHNIRAVRKSINVVTETRKKKALSKANRHSDAQRSFDSFFVAAPKDDDGAYSNWFEESGLPAPLLGRGRLDGNWGALFDDGKATYYDPQNPDAVDPMGFASLQGGRTPPLFLQELAHLASLLLAVAFATLRNDIDGAQSPLDFYEPGSPWPAVDPDKDQWTKLSNVQKVFRNFRMFFGANRSDEERTRYNAARPIPVIGGVSDNEIRFLQMARGPYAKTQLCWQWLSEFCIREHLAGSTGDVGAPIISRIIQFLGDGMIFYNHSRKIMFIPFPFVHAQLSVLFVVIMIPAIPLLMDQYTENVYLGALLTFFTVMCLSGVDEVAREMENPFRNVPNELPLVTLQAQFNEGLITMYAGYHPDHFWDGASAIRRRGGKSPTSTSAASDREEIMKLKKQLAGQAKFIEELAAKMNMDPQAETSHLESVLENGD